MELLEVIKARLSVRRYLDKPMETLKVAALLAPGKIDSPGNKLMGKWA